MKQSEPLIEKMSKLKQSAVVDKKPIDFSISMGYSDFPGQPRITQKPAVLLTRPCMRSRSPAKTAMPATSPVWPKTSGTTSWD